MSSRRDFIRKLGWGAAGVVTLSSFDLNYLLEDNDVFMLSIMHTNDMHSHIDPFPADHKRYPGMGGMARRATLIDQIRAKSPHNLLLDAGDIFQGTPYFNFYGGELEFKLMSDMGYDCATMGNHDFDNGLDGFNKMLPFATFPFVCSNYGFEDSILAGKTKPFKTFQRGPIKVGVFGIGIELDGLVNAPLYEGTKFMDPIEQANKWASHLRHEENCDLVICLSHLGYEYKYKKVCDKDMAAASKDIDLIIGGHTHTFMDEPKELMNANNQPILVNQVGWAGLRLGKIDFLFDKNSKKKLDNETAGVITKNYAKEII